MIRLLNVLAILALIGSAVYAYTIKYETIYRAEQIAKMKHEIQAERDKIGVLRAEWAHLARPERVQELATKYLDLQQLSLTQVVPAAAIPEKSARVDTIGRKLESLGLSEPTATPRDERSAVSRSTTPSSTR
jgi:cell division protein FtsL